MVNSYFNQQISWKRRTGLTDYGHAIFADAVMIPARLEYKRRLVRNAQGEEVMSSAFVMTLALVSLGDALVIEGREWPVVSVFPVPGLMGEEIHREVWL